jgi:carbon storage regulator
VLVITRKPGQTIHIGEGIVVEVVAVRGDQVRLAISADRSVPIHRGELLEQVAEANRAASTAAGPTGLPLPPLPRGRR